MGANLDQVRISRGDLRDAILSRHDIGPEGARSELLGFDHTTRGARKALGLQARALSVGSTNVRFPLLSPGELTPACKR
jgi:hypothetical protein